MRRTFPRERYRQNQYRTPLRGRHTCMYLQKEKDGSAWNIVPFLLPRAHSPLQQPERSTMLHSPFKPKRTLILPPPPESCHYWSSRKSLKRLMEFCEDERAKNLSWARDLFHGLPNGIRGEKSFLRMQVAAGQTKAAFRKFRRKKNLCCFPEIGSGPASFFAVTIWPNIKENAPPPISRIWPCRPSPFSKKKPWPVVNRPFKKKKNAP